MGLGVIFHGSESSRGTDCRSRSFRNSFASRQTIDLPSSKQLIEEVPGHPQRTNSLPISMAVSPDGRYVVT